MDRPLLPRRARRTAGFSLVELAIFAVLLSVGLMTLTTTALTVNSLRIVNREQQLANAALDSLVEEVRGFASTAREADPSWVAAMVARFGPGGALGGGIEVRGLTPPEGEPFAGTVTLVTDETATDAEVGVQLALPRDLDNDGAVDNDDVSATARILPVVARVRWTGRGGTQEVRQGFYVTGF